MTTELTIEEKEKFGLKISRINNDLKKFSLETAGEQERFQLYVDKCFPKEFLKCGDSYMEKRTKEHRSLAERPFNLGKDIYDHILGLCDNCVTRIEEKAEKNKPSNRICLECGLENILFCKTCYKFMLPSTLEYHLYEDGNYHHFYCKDCCKSMDFTVPPPLPFPVKLLALEGEDLNVLNPYDYRTKSYKKRYPNNKITITHKGLWATIDYGKRGIKSQKILIREPEDNEKPPTDEEKVNIRCLKLYRLDGGEDSEQSEDELIDPIDKQPQSILLENIPLNKKQLLEQKEDDDLILLDSAPNNVVFKDNDVIELYSTGPHEVIYVPDNDEDEVVISLKRPAPLEYSEREPKRLKSRYCQIVY